MTVFTRLLLDGVYDAYHQSQPHEGGGKGGSAAPVYTAPPAAPASTEAATLETADTTLEEEVKLKDAQKQGAKSLQIPLGGVGTGTTTTSSVVGKA